MKPFAIVTTIVRQSPRSVIQSQIESSPAQITRVNCPLFGIGSQEAVTLVTLALRFDSRALILDLPVWHASIMGRWRKDKSWIVMGRIGSKDTEVRSVGRPKASRSVVDGISRLPGFAEERSVHLESALGRGMLILRSFAVGDIHLGNAELALRTGLPKATVSRITALMTDLGYLNYRQDLGKYEVAATVLALCHSYLGNMPVPAIARPAMLDFARDEDVNVGLGIQQKSRVIYVESALGEPMNGSQRIGYSVPVAFSVMGLACIAGLPLNRREALLEKINRTATARQWKEISRNVEQATKEIHTRGFYIGIGILSERVNMVGIPYYHAPSGTMLAFNCGGSSPIQTPAKLQKLGPKLLRLVTRVRNELEA